MKRKTSTSTDILSKFSKNGESTQFGNGGNIPDESFTALKFTELIEESETELTALQRFCKACDLYKADPQKAYDIVGAYVTISPDFSALLRCLGKSKHSPKELAIAFECCINIFLRTASDLSETFPNTGPNLCSALLEGHVQTFYRCLGFKNTQKVKNVTLHLLSTMVMQGKNSARDVADCLDFSLNCFSSILQRQKGLKYQTAKYNLRVQYVQFVLSFLIAGDSSTVQKILNLPEFVSSIFKGLVNDSASLIHLFLTTLQDKVIKNIVISKTTKIHMISDVLKDISALFQWDGVTDIELEEYGSDTGQAFIRQLTSEFLYHACCPFKYGINFRDVTFGISAKSKNHVLLRFILSLTKVTSDSLIQDLVIRILNACPDLLSRYFIESQLCFKPRVSEKWLSNCEFLKRIYSCQPDVAPVLTYLAKTSSFAVGEKYSIETVVRMAMPGIIPPVFDNALFKQCLKHDSRQVQQKTLEVLSLILKKAKSSGLFLNDEEIWKNSLYTKYEVLDCQNVLMEAILKTIDFNTIILLWTEISKQQDVHSKLVRNLLLKILCLYYEIFPRSISQNSFDFTKLLSGIKLNEAQVWKNVDDSNQETIISILRLLSQAPQNYRWFKSDDSGHSPFYRLLNITAQCGKECHHNVKKIAISLLKKVMFVNELLLDSELKEVDVWVESLPFCGEQDCVVILNYLTHVWGLVVRQPNRFSAILQSTQENMEDIPEFCPNVSEDWWSSIPDVTIDKKVTVRKWTTDLPGDVAKPLSLISVAVLDCLQRFASENLAILDKYIHSVFSHIFYSTSSTNVACTFAHMVIKSMSNIHNCEKQMPLMTNWTKFISIWVRIENEENIQLMKPDEKGFQSQLEFWFCNCINRKSTPCSAGGIIGMLPVDGMEDALSQLLQFLDKTVHDIQHSINTTTFTEIAIDILAAVHHILQKLFVSTGGKRTQPESSFDSIIDKLLSNASMQQLFLKEDDLKFQYLNLDFTDHNCNWTNDRFSLSDITSSLVIGIMKYISNIESKKPSKNISFYFSRIIDTVPTVLSKLINKKNTPPDVDNILHVKALHHLAASMSKQELETLLNNLSVVISKVNTQKCAASCCKTVCKCLSSLLSKYLEVQNEKSLLKHDTIHNLLMFLSSGLLQNELQQLLHLLASLIDLFPFFALMASVDTLEYCYLNIEKFETESLLQQLILNNPQLRLHLHEMLFKTDTNFAKLRNLDEGCRLKLVPVLNVLLENDACVTKGNKSSVDNRQFFDKEVIEAYEDMIFNVDKMKLFNFNNARKAFLKTLLLRSKILRRDQLNLMLQRLIDSFQQRNFDSDFSLLQTALELKLIENPKQENKLKASLVEMCIFSAVDILSSKKRLQDTNAFTVILSNLTLILQQLSQDEYKEVHSKVSGLWSRFLKLIFKYKFTSIVSLKAVRQLIPVMLDVSLDHELGLEADRFIDPSFLKSLFVSHSLFLPILLCAEIESQECEILQQELKNELSQLYYEICVRCDKSALTCKDVGFLLSAYKGTLCSSDQNILATLMLYEKRGIHLQNYEPFSWGSNAMTAYQSRKNLGDTLWKKPNPNEILNCIDPEIMNSSLSRFPIRRTMMFSLDAAKISHFQNNPESVILASENNISNGITVSERVYDPCFMLPVFLNLLSPENLLDCRMFLMSGALPYLMACLASHCRNVRGAAGTCLELYYQHAESAWFPEKKLTLYLITCVRRSATTKTDKNNVPAITRVPSVVANFLSAVLRLHSSPVDHMFLVLHRFLLVKPQLDLKNIPEFYVLFLSAQLEYKIERSWILNLIAHGLRDMGDFHVVRKRDTFQLLMCFHDSPISDNHVRRQIFQIFEQACCIRRAVFSLIKDYGFLAWLIEVLQKQNLFDTDPSSAHSTGTADPVKRQNSTVHVTKVVKALWNTQNVLGCNVDEEASGNDELAGVEYPETKSRKHAALPLGALQEVVSVCIAILKSLWNMSDVRESKSRFAMLTFEIISAYKDTIAVLNSCLWHLREQRRSSQVKRGDNTSFNKYDDFHVTLEDARVLFNTLVMLCGACKEDLVVSVIEILTSWIPPMDLLIDEEKLVIDCITWIFNEALDTCIANQSWFDNHFNNFFDWMEHCLTVTKQWVDASVQDLVICCFNRISKNPSSDEVKSQKLFRCVNVLMKFQHRFCRNTSYSSNPFDIISNTLGD